MFCCRDSIPIRATENHGYSQKWASVKITDNKVNHGKSQIQFDCGKGNGKGKKHVRKWTCGATSPSLKRAQQFPDKMVVYSMLKTVKKNEHLCTRLRWDCVVIVMLNFIPLGPA